jgi:hypothetical protein
VVIEEEGCFRVTEPLYAGDYFTTLLPAYPPVVFGVKDYNLDRERFQKVYSYIRAKQVWVFRISDDPPIPDAYQGRLSPY